MNETQIEEEIEKYRKMGFEDESAKMQEIILGLWAGVDVSTYADPKFNWCQMEQLRLGLTQGLDVSSYADAVLSHNEMEWQRLNLFYEKERARQKNE